MILIQKPFDLILFHNFKLFFACWLMQEWRYSCHIKGSVVIITINIWHKLLLNCHTGPPGSDVKCAYSRKGHFITLQLGGRACGWLNLKVFLLPIKSKAILCAMSYPTCNGGAFSSSHWRKYCTCTRTTCTRTTCTLWWWSVMVLCTITYLVYTRSVLDNMSEAEVMFPY